MFSQDLITVFLMGLVGSVHCVGMCGGIASLLGGQIQPGNSQPRHILGFRLLYNTGRISSYILAGILIAVLGQLTAVAGQQAGLPDISRLVISSLTLFFGFYLIGWTFFLLPLEKVGSFLWRRIEPIARKLLPVRSWPQAFMLGSLWGWLPCGLVYVALSWAAASTDPVQGGLLMAAFGLGTLPAMLGMSLTGNRLGQLLARPGLRTGIGVLVIFYGSWMLWFMVAEKLGTGSHLNHL